MQRYKLVQEMVNNGYTADWQTVAKPDPNGSWCLHSDVENLEGEKKEFQSKADAYQSIVDQRNGLVEKLEGEIERLLSIVKPSQWSKEWPTKEGWYWVLLRGWREPRLAEVALLGGKPYYNCKYGQLRKQPACWTPAILPDTSGAVALLEGEE